MSRNGERRSPRPRIGAIVPAPSEQEAAAISAAIERFLTETAPATGDAGESQSAWQRAAIQEGVAARSELRSPWG
jgi:hypothetical protein